VKRNRRKQPNSAGDVSDTVQWSSPHPRLRYAKPKPQKRKKNSEKKGRERKEGNKEGQERERGRRPKYCQGPTSTGMQPGTAGILPGTAGICTCVFIPVFLAGSQRYTVHNGARYTSLKRSPFYRDPRGFCRGLRGFYRGLRGFVLVFDFRFSPDLNGRQRYTVDNSKKEKGSFLELSTVYRCLPLRSGEKTEIKTQVQIPAVPGRIPAVPGRIPVGPGRKGSFSDLCTVRFRLLLRVVYRLLLSTVEIRGKNGNKNTSTNPRSPR